MFGKSTIRTGVQNHTFSILERNYFIKTMALRYIVYNSNKRRKNADILNEKEREYKLYGKQRVATNNWKAGAVAPVTIDDGTNVGTHKLKLLFEYLPYHTICWIEFHYLSFSSFCFVCHIANARPFDVIRFLQCLIIFCEFVYRRCSVLCFFSLSLSLSVVSFMLSVIEIYTCQTQCLTLLKFNRICTYAYYILVSENAK